MKLFSIFTPLRSSRGIGLIGVLVASVILGIILMATIAVVVNHSKSVRQEQILATRDDLTRRLQAAVNDNRALLNSASQPANLPGDPQSLNACLTIGTPANCDASPGLHYFFLYDGFGTAAQLPLLAGDSVPSGNVFGGIYYDLYGKPCQTPSSTCILRARATYNIVCSAVRCLINTSAEVDLAPSATTAFGLMVLNVENSRKLTAKSSKPLPITATSSNSTIPVWDSNLDLNASSMTQAASPQAIHVGTDVTPVQLLVNGTMRILGSAVTPRLDVTMPTLMRQGLSNGASCASRDCNLSVEGNLTTSGTVWYHKFNILGTTDVYGSMISTSNVNITNQLSSPRFFYNSDKRLKTNISPIKNATQRLENLHGVSFVWKNSGQKDFGFIAQQVEAFEPELIETNSNGFKSFKYANVLAIIAEAYKEQSRATWTKINSQKNRIDQLEKEIDLAERSAQIENASVQKHD